MPAACDLTRWFGTEAVRIYAQLVETCEQRESRELCEFIQRRGGTITVRDVITYYRPLRNQRDEAERQLNALVQARFGEWFEDKGSRGPAAKTFSLSLSASAGFGKMPSKNTKPADADASNGSKSTASDQPGSGGDEWPYSRIEGDKIIIE